MVIDRAKLLKWLQERSATKSAVGGAVYAGLISRIERGEFDDEEGT